MGANAVGSVDALATNLGAEEEDSCAANGALIEDEGSILRTEDAGEELSIPFSRGSDDDKSALATRGLPFAAGPIFAAITSPTLAVAGHLGVCARLGGGANGYCLGIK
jgi:hypothetical protein